MGRWHLFGPMVVVSIISVVCHMPRYLCSMNFALAGVEAGSVAGVEADSVAGIEAGSVAGVRLVVWLVLRLIVWMC